MRKVRVCHNFECLVTCWRFRLRLCRENKMQLSSAESVLMILSVFWLPAKRCRSARPSTSEPFIVSGWQCTRPSRDRKTGETGGRRFLRCWAGGCACFQRLQAKTRTGFRLVLLPDPSRARCRQTTSELNIAPSEALRRLT